VVRAFARHYCAPEMLASTSGAGATGSQKLDIFLDYAGAESRDPRDEELAARVAELERQLGELQSVCDARQKVIDELDHAARERLALVEKLHAECAVLQKQLARGGAGR
jgi:hypothetical protein